ncbi:Lipopolysaccharide core heptosyltransferase RfaQ [bioreactor metagenome]|uniref:lipopolysaccharide heptosyltransferase II n=1 Tax=bioreactor metagenome TaxID=1076179 RepID=A0A644TPJ2_9ZZZZ
MNYKNILIIKLSAIGDVIHALPIASALKKDNPDVKITWIVEKPAYDLLTNNPYIDEIIVFDKKKYKSITGLLKYGTKLARELHSHNFDLAIDLQGLFKSAAIALLSGAKKRLVYCNARELSHLVSRRVDGKYSEGHVVDRYLDAVRHLGIVIDKPHFEVTVTDKEAARTKAITNKAGLDITKPYVVLAPGTNWPNKCWPTSQFSALADKLFDRGIIPVVIGGPKDDRLYDDIAANTNIPPVDLIGKTNLKELAYIIKHARVFVGGDTGPMHLAAAVHTPVVALFGPTDPNRNGPYGSGHLVLITGHLCKGCWRRQCPEGKDCLAEIAVNEVFEAVINRINLNGERNISTTD